MANDRKKYMRDVYPRYWVTAREKIYGFTDYERHLCSYVCQHVKRPARLLEVAVGTGYPFGDFLQKTGYAVYGVDISHDLVCKCKRLNPNIQCEIGDAENLPCRDDCFDFTYCFNSTWYFPNLEKALDEMLRVTRSKGLVMFDIQNRNNKHIEGVYLKNLSRHKGFGRIIPFAKNVAGMLLRRGIPAWNFVVHEVPTYPESIYEHLASKRISDFDVMAENNNRSIEAMNSRGSFSDFEKLVFVVRK